MQAGRPEKFKLVNYSVYYPVLQDCAHKTSKNLALILHLYAQKMSFLALFLQGYLTSARLLQDLARARKVDVNVHFLARILQDLAISWVCYFPITDKIIASCSQIYHRTERAPKFVQVKGNFFFIFPKLGQENPLNK